MLPDRGNAIQSIHPTLGVRHLPSGLNSAFVNTHLNFKEYIEHYSKVIAQVRSGNATPVNEQIIKGNLPFELKPIEGFIPGKENAYRRGILLIHGLSDSPYFMRHLALFFQEQGFYVMALLLPGHGTQPGDLLNVNWHDWVQAVNYGVEQLGKEVDEIFLGGFSAGGALSVYQSLCDQRIKGLFLFAPALGVSPKAAFANFHILYSWLLTSAKWLNVHQDTDFYKYESFPKNAAVQMHTLTRKIKLLLAKRHLEIPVFAVVSQDDATVDTEKTIDFMKQVDHPAKKLVYYYSNPQKIPNKFESGSIECVNSVLTDQNIASSAHTAIVLPGNDDYYGEHGLYCNCLHYYPNQMELYQACIDRSATLFQGEITRQNLKQGPMRRLMHNPHFNSLTVAMRQFISVLPA